MMRPAFFIGCVALVGFGCASSREGGGGGAGVPARVAVGGMLDDWHAAADVGDFDAYFGRMTEDAVFIGTDASERWVGAEFRAFSRPYFDGVNAWTYEPRVREVVVSGSGDVAWFDEVLESPKYGVCRGVGVAVFEDGVWRVAQYGLSFAVPNGVALEVVEVIEGYEGVE